MKVHSIKPARGEHLCARCPYPARIASFCAVIETGTHRIKHTKVYLCDRCIKQEELMKVGIFYFSLKPGKSRQWILINGGEGYIRVEVVSASLSDALDMAKPQPDESVMNTHVVAP